MAEQRSIKSNYDDDDASGLFKIGSILGLQTIEKAVEQSREKYLNQSIQKLQDNVTFHGELLTVQNSNILHDECLEQLDYIFNQSLVSNKTQLELTLSEKIATKRENIAKLSVNFAEQRKKLSDKYEQLRERQLSRCALHGRIVEAERALQTDRDTLKSLRDEVLTRKMDAQRMNDENRRIEQEAIIKFAKLMQTFNREAELKKKLVEHAQMKKRLEEKIKELQLRHMGKEMCNNDTEMSSDSANGIAKKLLISANLPRSSNNVVKSVFAESQSSELQKTTTRSKIELKHTKIEHKPNASFSKLNTSITNSIFYASAPFLHNANMATSKYFETSRTYTKKSVAKKYPNTTRADNNQNKSVIAPALDGATDIAPHNACKRVKFSNEVNEMSYRAAVGDAPPPSPQQQQPADDKTPSTKIEVINIIREDIVRAKSAQIVADAYDNEYGSNFAYLDGTALYSEQDEDGATIEPPETDIDNNKYSNEEMNMKDEDVFCFGRLQN